MGMSVGENTGGAMAEMNVVPLIDILLVLLIIFMVITPLTPKGMDALVPQPLNRCSMFFVSKKRGIFADEVFQHSFQRDHASDLVVVGANQLQDVSFQLEYRKPNAFCLLVQFSQLFF